MQSYFVRIGALAEVRAASGPIGLTRDCRVIVRTGIGLQCGEIVGSCRQPPRRQTEIASILRTTTRDDERLIVRLDRNKPKAVEQCRHVLAQSGSQSVLLDIDQMLDGGTLVLHFLGEVDQAAESITAKIVEQYESVIRTRQIAKLLRDGCGPDCGTGGGCETGTCSGCSLAEACQVR